MALFHPEPDIDDSSGESYCDRCITYLEVSCSITGYQLEVEFNFSSDDERTFQAE